MSFVTVFWWGTTGEWADAFDSPTASLDSGSSTKY